MLVNLSRAQKHAAGIQLRITPNSVKSRLEKYIVGLPVFEITNVLVRFDHIASTIVHANHSIV